MEAKMRGFGTLFIYGSIAAGVIILGLTIALKVQSSRLETRTQELATEKAAYAAFKADTKRLGEEAKAKAKAEIKRQEGVSNERVKSMGKRRAASTARFGLRDNRSNPGSGELPPVPEAARPTDDGSRDQRLRDILRHAQEQTDRLIELQEWIRQQEKP